MASRYRIKNHIEYDDKAYYDIIRALNSMDGSSATSICSSIESSISSFPDSYSSSSVSSVKSSIEGHVSLVKALSQTINYSVLAYQASDKELTNDINILIDSLFEEDNKEISDLIWQEIKGNVDDFDGALGYKEEADFSKLGDYFKVQSIIEKVLKNFDSEKFNINKDTAREELLYVYRVRGRDELEYLIMALQNNCPDNYFEYNFNPQPQNEGDGHYNYDGKIIKDYQTNSEFININGVEFEFAQVLPKDCTSLELLAYNFAKANVINTMRTFPEPFLAAAIQKNNVVVLTCSPDTQANKDRWGGYYCGSNFTSPQDGTVVIDVHGSFHSNDYYTRDAVIHEFAHKFDDILNGLGKFDNRILGCNYTDGKKEWELLYDAYSSVIPDIIPHGYTKEGFEAIGEGKISEFFAESIVAYFLDPSKVWNLCPDLYRELVKIFGYDCCGAYKFNIDDVISGNR